MAATNEPVTRSIDLRPKRKVSVPMADGSTVVFEVRKRKGRLVAKVRNASQAKIQNDPLPLPTNEVLA